MGHNDLAEEIWCSERSLAADLLLVGKRALEAGVKRVSFTELLPRFGEQGFDRSPEFLKRYRCRNFYDADEVYQWRMWEFHKELKKMVQLDLN